MFVSSLSLCAELRRDLPPTTKFKSKQQENHGKNCKQTKKKHGEEKNWAYIYPRSIMILIWIERLLSDRIRYSQR